MAAFVIGPLLAGLLVAAAGSALLVAATAGMATMLHPAASPSRVGGYSGESKYELSAGAFVVIASASSSVSS